MIGRFLPYLKYLKGRRLALSLALACGAISGLVYGYGLPKVINEVFPKIFTDDTGLPSATNLIKSPTRSAAKADNTLPVSTDEQLAAQQRIRAGRTLSGYEIVGYALLIPLIFLIRATSGFLNNYLMSYCGIGVLEALRVELYRKLQHLPLSYFGRNRSGDLLSRLTSDTQVVQQTITSSASFGKSF